MWPRKNAFYYTIARQSAQDHPTRSSILSSPTQREGSPTSSTTPHHLFWPSSDRARRAAFLATSPSVTAPLDARHHSPSLRWTRSPAKDCSLYFHVIPASVPLSSTQTQTRPQTLDFQVSQALPSCTTPQSKAPPKKTLHQSIEGHEPTLLQHEHQLEALTVKTWGNLKQAPIIISMN